MKIKTALIIATGTSFLSLAPLANAALSAYSSDFEGSTGDFNADGWLNFVSNPGGNYGFPLDGGQTQGTTVASGEGGAAQGNDHFNVFSNYDDGSHGTGGLVEYNVFQQQTTSLSDVGSSWTFSFDAKAPAGGPAIDPGSSASAGAFIKGFGPGFGFFFPIYNEDTTTLSDSTWTTFSHTLTLNSVNPGDWDNWIIQFGFVNTATNFDDSGVLYDNVSFSQVSAVPVPAAAWLFGSALLGLVAVRRKK